MFNKFSGVFFRHQFKSWSLLISVVVSLLSVTTFAYSSTNKPAHASNDNEETGPSFNCAKVTGGIEKVICDSHELSQLDLVLSKVYKTAKAIDPNIKHEQRLWIKQRNKCKGEKQLICLKKSYKARIEALHITIEKGIRVPENWESFVQSRWIKVLNAKCDFKEDEQHIRFVDHNKLDENHEILTVACMLGAYQDTHLVYLLTKYNGTVYAKQIVFFRPVYNGGWYVYLADKIIGYLMLDENRPTFSISMSSGGTGACGYNVSYNISDLYQSEPLKPVKLKGEDDCTSGVGEDGWPEIALPLPLSTGSN